MFFGEIGGERLEDDEDDEDEVDDEVDEDRSLLFVTVLFWTIDSISFIFDLTLTVFDDDAGFSVSSCSISGCLLFLVSISTNLASDWLLSS